MADPAKREQWKEWMVEFQAESDRACAVLGAAFLDEHVRALLEAFMVDDPKPVRTLLEHGPLRSFAARVKMAYALGFLAPSEIHDLNLIRNIRNKFAHDLHGAAFASPGVASLCQKLKHCDVVGPDFRPFDIRGRFTLSVVLLAQRIALRRLGIRDGRRNIQSEVKLVDQPKVGAK